MVPCWGWKVGEELAHDGLLYVRNTVHYDAIADSS